MTNEEALVIVKNILEASNVPTATLSVQLCYDNPPNSSLVYFVITTWYIYSPSAERELAEQIYNALAESEHVFPGYDVSSFAHKGSQMTLTYHSSIQRENT